MYVCIDIYVCMYVCCIMYGTIQAKAVVNYMSLCIIKITIISRVILMYKLGLDD